MHKKILVSFIAVLMAFALFVCACAQENGEDVDHSGEKYTVTLDVAGGDQLANTSVEVTYGEDFNLGTATRTDYTFDGWTYNDALITDNSGAGLGKWNIAQNVTVSAKWTEKVPSGSEDHTGEKFTVTLNVAGGEPLEYDTVEVTYGEDFDLGSTTRTDYTFDGWTYNGTLITDNNGAGLDKWNIAQNVTVSAKWTSSPVVSSDISGLRNAITAMGYNYTADVRYGLGLYSAYVVYATDDGIYQKYPSEYGSSGFIFKEDDLAYYFHLTDGIATIDEEPYTWNDGDPYTREYIYGRDYPVTAIVPEYFEKTAEGEYTEYSCKEDYLYQMGRALVSESYPTEIIIYVSGGIISHIAVNNFEDPDFGGTDSVWMGFSDIGETDISEFLITERPPFVSQLPSPTDPDKPQAPTEYTAASVKAIGSVDESLYVNGTNDDDLPELKAAIDEAREKINFHIDDYYDDTYNKYYGHGEPDTFSYVLQFDGYKSYVANARVGCHFIMSDGVVYAVQSDNGELVYTEKTDRTFESCTLNGNVFWKLNASMFTKTAEEGVYTIKSDLMTTVCDYLCVNARGVDELYNGHPRIVYLSATVKLEEGRFKEIKISRKFTFDDGSIDDLQDITYTFDYDEIIVMPYEEVGLTSEQQELANAVINTGSNYTLDYIYYDDWEILEYYNELGIWRERVETGGADGFVYINDYAYYINGFNPDGTLKVDDEPYKRYTNDDFEMYRAWMNLFYLPLVQIDAHDFTKQEDAFVLDSSKLSKYDNLFFDFDEEEGYMTGMTVYLDENGYISKIVVAASIYATGDTQLNTVYVGNIGSTTLPV